MDEKINIEDLIPTGSSFELSHTGLSYRLRPCTGGMVMKMAKVLGNIESLLASPTIENVSKMAVFLMEYEDAKQFKKQTVKTIDVMTGEEGEEDVGGYVLLGNMVSGIKEQMSIYRAILESVGFDKERIEGTINEFIGETNKAISKEYQDLKKKNS